jgi:hypothetical protein
MLRVTCSTEGGRVNLFSYYSIASMRAPGCVLELSTNLWYIIYKETAGVLTEHARQGKRLRLSDIGGENPSDLNSIMRA